MRTTHRFLPLSHAAAFVPSAPHRLAPALLAVVVTIGGCHPLSPEAERSVTVRLSGAAPQYAVTQWPTLGTALSSPFGPRLKASEAFRYDFHRGIDIPGDRGDPVVAAADGDVYRTYFEGDPASPYPNGGNVVITRHTFETPMTFHGMTHTRYYALYLHLDSILVAPATPGGPYEPIARGAPVGTLGQSGTTKFNHLHFEIRVGTTCSREYQQAHPQAACAGYFTGGPQDPHVNPLLLLDHPDAQRYTVQVLSIRPLRVRVSAGRDELDFNEIRVRAGNTEKAVNFNDRTGIDPADIDNPAYGGIVISPAEFSTRSARYEITFEFTNVIGYDWIDVSDVHGDGVRVVRGKRLPGRPASAGAGR